MTKTNFKKAIAIGVAVLAMGATSLTVLAASTYNTPAEALAGITGRTTESVTEERINTGKTYGSIAKDAGKLEEFQSANLELKKQNLDEQVAAGKMTKERAEELKKAITEQQENCDGTGSGKIGREQGAKFGSNGAGQGQGGTGTAQGRENRGAGVRNGACTIPQK